MSAALEDEVNGFAKPASGPFKNAPKTMDDLVIGQAYHIGSTWRCVQITAVSKRGTVAAGVLMESGQKMAIFPDDLPNLNPQ